MDEIGKNRGRHRAPTNGQLRRAAIAAAAALPATVVVPGVAVAAPESTWDRVAECESSGRWDINTGNGYYGGLQFSPQTWREFGGTGMPHEASKAEQIAVAERTLAGQGWNAWPVCSIEANARADKAEPKAKVVQPATTPVPAESDSYTVKPGDTLGKIAAPRGQSWKDLYEANKDVIEDPNMIYPGEQLDVAPRLAGAPATTPAKKVVTKAENTASASTLQTRIVASARSYTGRDIQYVWGGKSAKTGFDCSGFVWQVLKDAGLDVGYKNSFALRKWATPVPKSQAKAGDLLWWPGHIGVYVGNGRMVDAGNSKVDISERAVYGSPVYLRVYR